MPDPSSKQLANIAIGAADAYDYFTSGKAKVAFLSFSTQGSAEHPMVDKIKEAVAMARAKAPDADAGRRMASGCRSGCVQRADQRRGDSRRWRDKPMC